MALALIILNASEKLPCPGQNIGVKLCNLSPQKIELFMDKICVFVDFSPASQVAIKYACTLATKANAILQILHVAGPDNAENSDALRKELQSFASDTEVCEVKTEAIIEFGDFQRNIPELLVKHKPDLILIATHGVKGIFHTMQGPEVLKLIQKINVPSLVIQERTPREYEGYEYILFPISLHANFQVKIDQTMMIAKVFGSKVLVYILTPSEGDLEEALQQNLERTEKSFSANDIEYEEIFETSKVYGVGYARQALEYSKSRKVDLFAIMAHASEEHAYFGNVERSQFLLNEHGIPVLCCTD